MAKLSAKQLYLAALTHEFSEKNTGIISEASESALEVSDSLGDYTCIDVIGQGEDVSEVIIDQPRTTFQRSAERLLQLNHKTISEAGRAMIASPGTEAGKTLSTALSAFWNVMRGVKDGGIAILLAEASEGLGSTALQLYVSGRLDVDAAIRKGQYVEGLEDLILLRRAQKLFKLVLVTSLPNYYSEVKLGLHALRKASDAVTEVFTNQGSKCKILMVSDASNTLISTNSH
jgi:nickel-dependent lactate racemase